MDSLSKLYSKADLALLVAYAAERGVQIVPELDMPAHSRSWGHAFRPLVVDCRATANIYPLDPSLEMTYTVAEQVLRQLVEVFPSQYLHVGGDEVCQCVNVLLYVLFDSEL
jgi:hexosaminidase